MASGDSYPVAHDVLVPTSTESLASSRRPLRGRANLTNVQVKQQQTFLTRIFSVYVVLLRVPLPIFCACLLSGPILLSLIFTLLFMLAPNGLYMHPDADWKPSTRFGFLEEWLDPIWMRVFLFSFSLSTTFGGARVEARSPYALLVANLNTLCAQLVLVFLSGAVFQRLSQPASPVRWSSVALITDDFLTNAFAAGDTSQDKYKVFLARLVLAGSSPSILVDAKFDLIVLRHVKVEGSTSPFITTTRLPLVRSEVSYLRYGMLLRHVIDESSPLYNKCDFQSLYDEDASFTISVSAMERSTMQPVFGACLYSVNDGDVVWDRQYVDLVSMDPRSRMFVIDQKKLTQLKPIGPSSEPATNVPRDVSRMNVRPETLSPGM